MENRRWIGLHNDGQLEDDPHNFRFIAESRTFVPKAIEALEIAIDTLNKISSTDCGEPHIRWCCQFSDWANNALKRIRGE
jgi:hypothetical protein